MKRKPLFIPADEEIHKKLELINEMTGVTKTTFVNWAVQSALRNWDMPKIEKIKRNYVIFGESVFNDDKRPDSQSVT